MVSRRAISLEPCLVQFLQHLQVDFLIAQQTTAMLIDEGLCRRLLSERCQRRTHGSRQLVAYDEPSIFGRNEGCAIRCLPVSSTHIMHITHGNTVFMLWLQCINKEVDGRAEFCRLLTADQIQLPLGARMIHDRHAANGTFICIANGLWLMPMHFGFCRLAASSDKHKQD